MKSITLLTAVMVLMQGSDVQANMSEDAIQLKTLYEELQNFKDDPQFHEVGFGSCCRFHDWQQRVKELEEQSGSSLLFELGVLPGDLLVLGLEYMRSKGQPTPYTEDMEPEFMEAVYE
jgi:hypothetical protein